MYRFSTVSDPELFYVAVEWLSLFHRRHSFSILYAANPLIHYLADSIAKLNAIFFIFYLLLSCLVFRHRSPCEFIFGYHIRSIFRRHWGFFVIVFLTSHISKPYRKTGFTVVFNTFFCLQLQILWIPNTFSFWKIHLLLCLFSLRYLWLTLHRFIINLLWAL